MRDPLQVLVVDDSLVVRRVVTDALGKEPDLRVTTAPGARAALARIAEAAPDAIILDVEMPEMNGIALLRQIRQAGHKMPVIMFSTLTESGAATTLEALAAGATDYVTKPSGAADLQAAMDQIRVALGQRIRALSLRKPKTGAATPPPPPPRRPSTPAAKVELVAIAASTGGPNALTTVLAALPRDLSVPVVIVQHMPPLFTGLFAKALSAKCPLRVREGEHGARVQPGDVWIAPGGRHMVLTRDPANHLQLALNDDPLEQSCRPAADPLFRSAAKLVGRGVLGVVLTGMGQDGTNGSEAIHAAGGRIIVQDEATSVVWGMPGSVCRAGLAEAILPLEAVAADIARRCAGTRAPLIKGVV